VRLSADAIRINHASTIGGMDRIERTEGVYGVLRVDARACRAGDYEFPSRVDFVLLNRTNCAHFISYSQPVASTVIMQAMFRIPVIYPLSASKVADRQLIDSRPLFLSLFLSLQADSSRKRA